MDTQLVRMAKDGATLDVHPTCVNDHLRLGWAVSPRQPEAGNDEDDGPADDALKAARADYEAAFGKKPFHGWPVETIRTKIAEKAKQ
jgi:hypothetical protein